LVTGRPNLHPMVNLLEFFWGFGVVCSAAGISNEEYGRAGT
jgi:hypothetical protein